MTKSAPKPIVEFTRQNLRSVNDAIMAALREVGQEYGFTVAQEGNGRFTPEQYRLRINFNLPAQQRKSVDSPPSAKKGITPFPAGLPVTTDDIGKTIRLGREEFMIAEYLPNRRNKSVRLLRVRDGREFITTPEQAAQALGRNPFSADNPDPNVYPGNWDKLPSESFDEYEKRTDAMLAVIPADKLIRFPRGDGYAMYFVKSLRPLHLQHIPYGDAWHADPIMLRHLNAKQVQELLSREVAMNRLFAGRAHA